MGAVDVKGSSVTCSISDSQSSHALLAVLARRRNALLIASLIALSIGGVLGTDTESASASWSARSTSVPTESPAPSPTPTETAHDSDEKQDSEPGVERDDLGLLGLLFVGGIGFLLATTAAGALLVARERRRRDGEQPITSDVEPADD
ncbi:MAG: hypothetical protein WBA87_02235 [Microbacterium sp.]|jgi:disulfide bond formation protein DsbB